MDSRTGLSWESTLHRIVLKYVLSFVVLQYILARVAGDRAEKKKDAKGRRLVDRGSVYSIGFASSHRPTTEAGKCPFELGKFFSKKVPQTIRARV